MEKNHSKVKKVFWYVCEGKNQTERLYLQNFASQEYNMSLQLVKTSNTDAEGMCKALHRETKGRINYNNGDKAFCIIDIDKDLSKLQKINELKQKRDYKNFTFIISNPYIELWFLLHFTPKPKNNKKEVMAELLEYVPNYKKSFDIYNKCSAIKTNTEVAIERAKQIKANIIKNYEKLDDIYDFPYTQFDELMECILNEKVGKAEN